MKFKKPVLICTDWDNTIVDTDPVSLMSLNLFFDIHNKPRINDTDLKIINGMNFELYFKSIFPEKNIDEMREIRENYANIYLHCARDFLEILENSEETLKKIEKLNISCVVISNKFGSMVRGEASRFEFSKYFSTMIGPDDAGFAKPDRKIFEFALQEIQFNPIEFNPDNLWYFGDSNVDFLFAKAINARLFFFGNEESLRKFANEEELKNTVFLKNHKDFIDNIEIE